MPISVRDGDTWVEVNVHGPRGRARKARARVDLTIDKEGIHSKAEFMGPLGGIWNSSTTITFQEIIEVIKQKPNGLKSFIKLAPSDLAYVLKEILES